MGLVKRTYVDGETVITADNLNDIQDEIIQNASDISTKGTYSKPSGGIPSTDLSSAVQTSLEKADTALQSSDIDSTLTVTGKAADAKKTGDEISGLKNTLNADLRNILTVTNYAPNYSNFDSVASGVRGGGNTNGTNIAYLKSITAKLKKTASGQATIYLIENYIKYGAGTQVNSYKVYDSFTINIPATNGEVLTFYNGSDFTYNSKLKENTHIAIFAADLSTYYYTDGTKGLAFGASIDPTTEYRAVDVESNYNISIGFAVDNYVTDTLEEEIDELQNEDVIFSYVPDFTNMTSQLPSLSSIVIGANTNTESGSLYSIVGKFYSEGPVDFYLFVPWYARFKVIGKITFEVKSGVYEYINGIDFNYNSLIPPCCYIGVGSSVSTVYYGTPTDGYTGYGNTDHTTMNVGDIFIPWNRNYDIAVGIKIKKTKTEIRNEKDLVLARNHPARTGILPIGEPQFADTDQISCIVIPDSLSGTLDLIRSGAITIQNGSAAFVNFGTGKYGFYKAISTADDTLTVHQQEDISLTLVAGRKYGVVYTKTITGFKLAIIDCVTLEKSETTINNATAIGGGHGVVSHSESSGITVSDFKHISFQNATPKTLVIGDSWTDGNTMNDQKANRWCSLYSDAVDGNTFVFSMGGGSAFNGEAWLAMLKDVISPEYVIIEFGVNQSDLVKYKHDMNQIIAFVEKMEAMPVLVLIPPTNGASSSIYSQINSWVKASGYQYIDMCTPLTVDGAGTTRNSELFFADGTHPNVAGHLAIFKEMQLDVPELFEELTI